MDLSGVLGYIGVATFCIVIVTPVFPIEESLKKKGDIYKAVAISLFFIWVVYVLFADITALLFYNNAGSVLKPNILLNLPPNGIVSNIVRASMAAVCVLTYTLTLLISAQMIEKVLLIRFPQWVEQKEKVVL